MKLVLLGTTGYHPSEQRQTACFMLPAAGIVLDAGTGMFRARQHLATDELDIFLSHAHLDHIVGLTFLFDVLFERNVKRVTVHARESTIAAINDHLLATPLFPVALPCEYRPLAGEVPLAAGGRLTHFPLEHPGGSTGFRLDWPGRSLAYVTDTVARPGADYIAAIRGVDLLVHECYFDDSMQEWAERTGHSSTTGVAQVAREAEVGRLVLVHVNPLLGVHDPIGLEVAQAIFPRTGLGVDGMEIDF
ncbi:MAG: MBL fold metallo-hydrolase [Pirellulales bacterium]